MPKCQAQKEVYLVLLTIGHRERRLFGQPSSNRTHRATAACDAGRRGKETTVIGTGGADRNAHGGRPGGGRQGRERRGVDAADGRGNTGQGREVGPEPMEPREGTGAHADPGSGIVSVLWHLGQRALEVKQRKTD